MSNAFIISNLFAIIAIMAAGFVIVVFRMLAVRVYDDDRQSYRDEYDLRIYLISLKEKYIVADAEALRRSYEGNAVGT